MIFAKSIFEKTIKKSLTMEKCPEILPIDDVTEIIGRLIYKSPKADKKNIKDKLSITKFKPFYYF